MEETASTIGPPWPPDLMIMKLIEAIADLLKPVRLVSVSFLLNPGDSHPASVELEWRRAESRRPHE